MEQRAGMYRFSTLQNLFIYICMVNMQTIIRYFNSKMMICGSVIENLGGTKMTMTAGMVSVNPGHYGPNQVFCN